MPKIYVNTDNSNSKAKIYDASKMGTSAAAAEKKMQEVITALVAKEADFVSDKSAVGKGYTVRIKVTKAEKAGGTTTYTVHPEIVRYPSSAGKGGKGELMVSTRVKDLAIKVEGRSEDLLMEGVAGVTENIMRAAFPAMRADMQMR